MQRQPTPYLYHFVESREIHQAPESDQPELYFSTNDLLSLPKDHFFEFDRSYDGRVSKIKIFQKVNRPKEEFDRLVAEYKAAEELRKKRADLNKAYNLLAQAEKQAKSQVAARALAKKIEGIESNDKIPADKKVVILEKFRGKLTELKADSTILELVSKINETIASLAEEVKLLEVANIDPVVFLPKEEEDPSCCCHQCYDPMDD
jgi:hypothetical protein